MSSARVSILVLPFIFLFWGLSAAGPIGIFYDENTSRAEILPEFQSMKKDTSVLNLADQQAASKALQTTIHNKSFVFERVLSKQGATAYIYRAQEMGKVQWMDFAIALDEKGQVLRVLLTAYRESIGGEVKSNRFMKQFIGKNLASTLQVNRDIDCISGATLSSRAITLGVKKALFFWNLKYGKNGKN